MGMPFDPNQLDMLIQNALQQQGLEGVGGTLVAGGAGTGAAGAGAAGALGAASMAMPIIGCVGMGLSAIGQLMAMRQARKEASKQRSLQQYGIASQEGAANSAALQNLMQLLLQHSGRGM